MCTKMYAGFSRDIWRVILNFLDEKYWINLKCLNKKFKNLFNSNIFIKNLPITKIFARNHVESLHFYLKNGFVRNIGSGLQLACRRNHIEVVKLLFLSRFKFDIDNLNNSMYAACISGNREIIDIIIQRGENEKLNTILPNKGRAWDSGLRGACCKGSVEIVKLMIDMGATRFESGLYIASEYNNMQIIELILDKIKEHNNTLSYFNAILMGACQGGHPDLIEYAISKGADKMNHGLSEACHNGNINIIELLIKNGANNWNYGLDSACMSGNREAIDLMIEKGATHFNNGLINACCFGHLEIAEYMIDKGANAWNSALEDICEFDGIVKITYRMNDDNYLIKITCGGKIYEIIKLLIKKGATNFNVALIYASKHNHLDIVKDLIEKGATSLDDALEVACSIKLIKLLIEKGARDVNRCLIKACRRGRQSVIEYLIKKGANDFNNGLIEACISKSLQIVQLMVGKGANNLTEALRIYKGNRREIPNFLILKGATLQDN